ncbi:MAG: sigma-70 family RNA polymerase sigma factor [Thermoanaerobaculia bacterium]|nr:sigma-70 family RNA polymerase sigma factor [Thermoanaerobaculia bacterium]
MKDAQQHESDREVTRGGGIDEDAGLVRRAARGDRQAFRAIVERHQGRVYRLALGLLANHGDAQDVVQEVFIRAYRSLKWFRGESGLGTWLYRITLNATRDLQRRRRWVILGSSVGLVPESQELVEWRADANPERSAASRQVSRDVRRALDALSKTERRVFVLRHVEQLSVKEAAEVLGRAEGTVKNLLFRALRKLRPLLDEHRPRKES